MMKFTAIPAIFILLTFSLLLLSGCDMFDGDNSDGHIDEIITDIAFSISEGYESWHEDEFPKFLLYMETEGSYPCYNFEIVAYFSKVDSDIFVDIQGIYMPNMCDRAIGPARYKHFFELDQGEYTLNFNYRTVTDKYQLTVTDSFFTVSEFEPEMMLNDQSKVYRIPEKSLTISCAYHDSAAWVLNDLSETIGNSVHIEEIVFPDDGEDPYESISDVPFEIIVAKSFIYNEEDDFITIGDILDDYISNFNEFETNTYIQIRNWRNEFYQGMLR